MAYTKTVWVTGDVITASLANHWETQYDEAKADLDAALDAASGHTHSGAAGDGPKLPDASLASGVATASTANTIAKRDGSGNLTAKQLISDVADGTPPLQVTSTTLVPNLNADLLDGAEASTFARVANGHTPPPGTTQDITITLGFRPILIVAWRTKKSNSYSPYATIWFRYDTGTSEKAFSFSFGNFASWFSDGPIPITCQADGFILEDVIAGSYGQADGFILEDVIAGSYEEETWWVAFGN